MAVVGAAAGGGDGGVSVRGVTGGGVTGGATFSSLVQAKKIPNPAARMRGFCIVPLITAGDARR